MGLFDLFSNDSAELAANQRNQGLQAGYDKLTTQYGAGRDAISAGANTATGYYQPLMASTGAGATAYGNASGANGATGLKTAMDDFHNSGQYGNFGFALTNGLQALDRTHAAAGNLSSGNADADTLKYATGLADNTYNSYAAGLQPYLAANANSVGGAAGVATGAGGALNNSFMAQGNAANANDTAQGASTAAATMNNYNVGANQFGALMGAANLGASAFGGGGGGFNLGPTSVGGPGGPKPVSGGLFSMFS